MNKNLFLPIYEKLEEEFKELRPFRKENLEVNGKEKEIFPWYNSYNKIKHDRVKNYKQANS